MGFVAAQASEIAWKPSFSAALTEAKASKKLIMVDFYTDWCGWCKKLDKDTYPDAKVVKQATKLVAVKVNAEKGTGPELAKKYGADGYPTIAFVSPDQKLVYRVVGYLPPAGFLGEMQKAEDAFKNKPIFERNLRDNPNSVSALAGLVPIYASTGDKDKALSLFARLEKLDKNNTSGKLDGAYNAIGDLYQSGNDPAKAVTYFLKATTSKDQDKAAYAMISLATCYAMQNDVAKAKPYLKKVLAMGKAADPYRDQAKQMLDQIK